jgi:subtilase family serine protease
MASNKRALLAMSPMLPVPEPGSKAARNLSQRDNVLTVKGPLKRPRNGPTTIQPNPILMRFIAYLLNLSLAAGIAAVAQNGPSDQQGQNQNQNQENPDRGRGPNIVDVGGPLRPGFVRPPLLANVQPASSIYYTPAQIRTAYGINKVAANGTGQTIAIVDAYGSSTLQSDMNSFCSQFGLSPTTVAVYYPQGIPSGNSGWAQETALDVEWAHAIAPGATIALVVAIDSSFANMLGAVDYAVNTVKAQVVSMSWGGSEFPGQTGSGYDGHFNASGVTFVASSGDSGESTGVEWPAASPNVVSVGGTSLTLDSSANYVSETAWSGSGGGISLYESMPTYQNGWTGLSSRGVPDVSYVADPNTGLLVVWNGYLYVFGGTSVGAPQWSALFALANQSRPKGSVAGITDVYKAAGAAPNISTANFFDITSGSNGSDTDDLAVKGYDLVTGLGSPVANSLVPALAPAATQDFSISVTPSSQTVAPGAGATYKVTVGALGGFSEDVGLAVSGLPTGANGTLNPVLGGSGSSTLTVSTISGTTPVGTYTLTITGTGATSGKIHAVSATLVVATQPTQDFSISATPSSRSVRRGNSTSYTVTITPSGGFNGKVVLAVSGLPSNATGTFNPSSITGSGSSTLRISTRNSTPRGTYSLTIKGTCSSPSLTHTTSVGLTVN